MMKHYSHLQLIALLAPLVFAFAVGQDIFVPEVPQLIHLLHTTQGAVQLTLSLFMLAVGVGQFIVGPLSDRFGRKPVVLWSIGCYAVGSLAAALAHGIVFLIMMRIVQGMGACGMMVCAFAIVRDLLAGDESAQIYSYLNGAIAISPLLAPLVGGYLDSWFGWHAPFFALAILGVLAFIMIASCFSETLEKKEKQLSILMVFKHYGIIVKNKQFLTFTFIASSALACFFTFFSISPYVLIQILHVSETHFGLYFAIMGVFFFLGSVIAGRLISRIGLLQVAILGCALFLLSGLIMLSWTFWLGTSIASFIIPSALSAIGGAFMMGAGAGGALEPFSEMTGTAAALLGASQFLFATLIGTIALQKPVASNLPFAIALIIFGGLALVSVLRYQYKKVASVSSQSESNVVLSDL